MTSESEKYKYAKDQTARWKIGYDERSEEEREYERKKFGY